MIFILPFNFLRVIFNHRLNFELCCDYVTLFLYIYIFFLTSGNDVKDKAIMFCSYLLSVSYGFIFNNSFFILSNECSKFK